MRVSIHLYRIDAVLADVDPPALALLDAGRFVRRELPPGAAVRYLTGGEMRVSLPDMSPDDVQYLAARLEGSRAGDGFRVHVRASVERHGSRELRGCGTQNREGPHPSVDDRIVPLLHKLEARDGYTCEHSERVCRLSGRFARYLGLGRERLRALQSAALAHDIGKLLVPRSILQKPGPLLDEERDVILRHPLWGAAIIRRLGATDEVAEAVRCHHEWWNGRGYPEGRSHEDIPFLAQLLAIVDAFDAMTGPRPYAVPRSVDDALAEIERNAGNQFAPGLGREFCTYVRHHLEDTAQVMLQGSAHHLTA